MKCHRVDRSCRRLILRFEGVRLPESSTPVSSFGARHKSTGMEANVAAFLWGDLDQDRCSKICLDHGASKDESDESMIRVDSSVPLIHRDSDRSWITDPDPDHPKGTHPKGY